MRLRILLIVLCVACVEGTDVDDLMVLSISSDQATVSALDPGLLTVTLVNHNSQAVTLPAQSCGPYFFIRDSLAHALLPPQYQCVQAPHVTVDAHDSVVFFNPWAGEARTNTGTTDQLTPGTYQIIGLMRGVNGAIESTPISVKVMATP